AGLPGRGRPPPRGAAPGHVPQEELPSRPRPGQEAAVGRENHVRGHHPRRLLHALAAEGRAVAGPPQRVPLLPVRVPDVDLRVIETSRRQQRPVWGEGEGRQGRKLPGNDPPRLLTAGAAEGDLVADGERKPPL